MINFKQNIPKVLFATHLVSDREALPIHVNVLNVN